MEENKKEANQLLTNGVKDSANAKHIEATREMPAKLLPEVTTEPKIPFPSCRSVLVAMGFFAFINVYCLRVNLSVALVAMVNQTYLKELETVESSMQNGTVTTSHHNEDVCPGDNATSTAEDDTGIFKWNAKQQGIVLAAFFYGYTTTQIAGGTLAQKVGGKLLLLFGILWTAILTLLTPVLTIFGGFGAIVAVRILEGVGEGVTYPSMHAMFSKWAPPLERSKMATFVYAGAQMGTVLGMPLSGILCQYLGWESVFYAFGVLGVIWSIMWFFLAYNTPATHPRISPQEREFIESSLQQKSSAAKGSLRVPWLSVAKSLPMYALGIAHFTCNWGYYTLLTCLPLYFKHILHFDIKSNGLVSGAPYLMMWITIVLSGLVADQLRTRKSLPTTKVRKLANAIGFIGPAICLIATGYVKCNTSLAVALIITAVGLSGISFAGWSVNHLDLAPAYAGTLMGITNTLATLPGFIGPSVVGVITYRNHTRAAWRAVFYIAAGVYAFGTIFYAIFGSGELQPWGEPAKSEEMEELQVVKEDGKEKDEKKSEEKKLEEKKAEAGDAA